MVFKYFLKIENVVSFYAWFLLYKLEELLFIITKIFWYKNDNKANRHLLCNTPGDNLLQGKKVWL